MTLVSAQSTCSQPGPVEWQLVQLNVGSVFKSFQEPILFDQCFQCDYQCPQVISIVFSPFLTLPPCNFFSFSLFIYPFIFFLAGSSLLCKHFLQLWQVGATLCCGTRASHCDSFSHCRAWALGLQVSVIVAHRLSSCAWYQLLHSMWSRCRPSLKSMSPPLAGGHCATREVLLVIFILTPAWDYFPTTSLNVYFIGLHSVFSRVFF